MIIAQISDTHIDPDHEHGPARLRDLEACIDDINSLDIQPDIVVHTGDMAHNGNDGKYRQASAALAKLNTRLLVCAGNRDERILLNEHFGIGRRLNPDSLFLEYVVDDFPVRLVVLDTLNAQSNQGAYCDDRADGLRTYLSSDTSKATVLFMHHPPFEVVESKYPHQFDPWEGAERVAAALDGQRHVIHGFCGHTHRDARGEVAGIPFSTVPSIARDLRLGDYGAEREKTPLYHLHTLDETGAFRTEIRAAGGNGTVDLSSAAD